MTYQTSIAALNADQVPADGTQSGGFRQHERVVNDAAKAIAAELGAGPKGTDADVTARLDRIDDTIDTASLPAASSVNGTDIVRTVQGGVSKQATAAQIQTAGGVIPASLLTNPLGLTTEGIISWNPEYHTINIQDDHPDSRIQPGYELAIRAVNKTGATIPNGTVVWISGAQGNRPTIEPAIATSANAGRAIAITTYNVADNAEARVVTHGDIDTINTSGWAVGDRLYLSATVPGIITNVAPTAAGTIQVEVGEALNSTNNGKILAKIHDFQSTAFGASLTLAADATAARDLLGSADRIRLQSLTKTNLSAIAISQTDASIAFCSDASGGGVPVYIRPGDTVWRRFDTNAEVI